MTTTAPPRPSSTTRPQPLGAVIPRDTATLTLTRTGRSVQVQYMAGTPVRVHAAAELGAQLGDQITVKYWHFEAERFVIAPNGGGDRTPNGWWADPIR